MNQTNARNRIANDSAYRTMSDPAAWAIINEIAATRLDLVQQTIESTRRCAPSAGPVRILRELDLVIAE